MRNDTTAGQNQSSWHFYDASTSKQVFFFRNRFVIYAPGPFQELLKTRKFNNEASHIKFNLCRESDQLIVNLNFDKNGWAKRSKKREAKLRVKNEYLKYFDAKLRFALLASLRSAIFGEIQVDN